MPGKVYIIKNLDCANCAAKIEMKFNDHPQVESAAIAFATGQLHLTAADPDSLIPELQRIAQTVESGAVILPREEAHGHHDHDRECSCGHHHDRDHACACGHHHDRDHACACGHHHDRDHACACGHHHDRDHACACGHHRHTPFRGELIQILAGAGLFVAGMLLQTLELGLWSLVTCGAAYVVLGWEILGKAGRNLVKGHVLDENFLMSIASLGAFLIGEHGEGVGVMLFYRVGEYFEERAMEHSRRQIMDAVDLRPETVNRLHDGNVQVIPAAQARVGDLLLVRPGDRIPLDGTVVSGESRVDTAPITGESVPVRVCAGNEAISGCVNGSGQLVIRVEKELSESMVTRILSSVENAAASKPKIDRFISRFARVYTPVVVAAAAVIALVPSLLTQNWNYWVYTALSFLVMSCPCALVLSVPLAYFSGVGAGSKRGILFKGGASMEAMGRIRAVVMDKTGTLTRGDFRVRQIAGGLDVLQLCAGCEQHSTHPIAQSITAAAKEQGMVLQEPESMEELPGRGIRARVNRQTVLCGNALLLQEAGISFPEAETSGAAVVYVAVDGGFYGWVSVSDTVKEDARQAVAELEKMGLSTVMLTGDRQEAADAVAAELGIRDVRARLLPHQKLEQLRSVRSGIGPAMFVGDGINDAPVLAGSDVGAAMGTGADAAIEAADVVFMTGSARAIPQSLAIARQTNAIARQNVVFALAVKALVMVLGLMGHASMWLAVFADSGVAMLCVLNAIRMLYKK